MTVESTYSLNSNRLQYFGLQTNVLICSHMMVFEYFFTCVHVTAQCAQQDTISSSTDNADSIVQAASKEHPEA